MIRCRDPGGPYGLGPDDRPSDILGAIVLALAMAALFWGALAAVICALW
jgi:hypothetical protein